MVPIVQHRNCRATRCRRLFGLFRRLLAKCVKIRRQHDRCKRKCLRASLSVAPPYMTNEFHFDLQGNTAMHYAVSHGNFDVVSILLDSKVCCINKTNNAGYTCVMLVSLAKLDIAEHQTVVQRLFQMADVNVRAKKHGQTALMLATSHGNYEMVRMLLDAGADINIQDEDGSTALMCAAEHGRMDIVKILLAQPDCDSTIQDLVSAYVLNRYRFINDPTESVVIPPIKLIHHTSCNSF